MEQRKSNLKIVPDKKSARMILPNMLTLIGVCIGLTSIRFALDEKYEIHFAREDMSFKKNNIDRNDLNFLISYSLTHHRDDNSLID